MKIGAYRQGKESYVQVGLNIPSLIHRARSQLPLSSSYYTAWRLITDHIEPAWEPFKKFQLSGNSEDIPYNGPIHLQHPLGDAQSRNLQWMHMQERGISLTITEIEEEVYAQLGWRVEARANLTVTIRGGALANLPSFGKTVTTVALIQTESERANAAAILEENQVLSHDLPGLIDVAATLIVCPQHIVK